MFLRGISQMPAAERQAYLADPTNRQNYMKMLEDFRSGIGKEGQGGGNLLTPEYVNSFGLGSQGDNGSNDNAMNFNPIKKIGAIVNALTGNTQQPQQQSQPGNLQQPSAPMPQNNNGLSQDDINDTHIPTTEESNGNNLTPPEQPPMQLDMEWPQPLSPKERDTLSSQLLSNKNAAGKVQSARAEGAATLDKFLLDNRAEFSKVINDAIKYQGLYGRGARWLDKFKENQPEEYANFMSVKTSLTEHLGNQIRFMEHMGATDAQSKAAEDMSIGLDKLDQSPETSRKVINKSLGTLFKLSDAVYNVAEPRYPGVYKKLHGIPTLKGDYLPTPKKQSAEPVNEKNVEGQAAGPDMVWLINPKTKMKEQIHKDWIDELINKQGYEEVE